MEERENAVVVTDLVKRFDDVHGGGSHFFRGAAGGSVRVSGAERRGEIHDDSDAVRHHRADVGGGDGGRV